MGPILYKVCLFVLINNNKWTITFGCWSGDAENGRGHFDWHNWWMRRAGTVRRVFIDFRGRKMGTVIIVFAMPKNAASIWHVVLIALTQENNQKKKKKENYRATHCHTQPKVNPKTTPRKKKNETSKKKKKRKKNTDFTPVCKGV